MILGIGTDIVEISRISKSITRYGDKFAERILASSELSDYRNDNFPDRFLAKRFAAKEALAKSLGTGFRNGLAFHHVVISHDALGKPMICLEGDVSQSPEWLAVSSSHISISDEREYVVAFVILES